MNTIFDLAALALGLSAVASVGYHTLVTGSPPTPSSARLRRALLHMVPPGQGGLILELGSGFGGLARMLAARHPEALVMGYERSPLPWLVSRLWLAVRPLPNLVLRRGDCRAAPIGAASVVTCYLTGPAMAALEPVLREKLSAGAVVVSATFALPGWAPVSRNTADDVYRSPVYVYRKEAAC